MHPAAMPEEELLKACAVSRTRRGGPGGQHRNKVSTAVSITHTPTGITGAASERRSQAENLKVAVRRLRVNLALGVRSSVADGAGPSATWRLPVNPDHADFPTVLAEALDVIEAMAGDVSAAADRLKCTSSQLVKLLKNEPRALEQVNARRLSSGLRSLR